jgi:hypothetical protein
MSCTSAGAARRRPAGGDGQHAQAVAGQRGAPCQQRAALVVAQVAQARDRFRCALGCHALAAVFVAPQLRHRQQFGVSPYSFSSAIRDAGAVLQRAGRQVSTARSIGSGAAARGQQRVFQQPCCSGAGAPRVITCTPAAWPPAGAAHAVLGERAGLVHAQHGGGAQGFDHRRRRASTLTLRQAPGGQRQEHRSARWETPRAASPSPSAMPTAGPAASRRAAARETQHQQRCQGRQPAEQAHQARGWRCSGVGRSITGQRRADAAHLRVRAPVAVTSHQAVAGHRQGAGDTPAAGRRHRAAAGRRTSAGERELAHRHRFAGEQGLVHRRPRLAQHAVGGDALALGHQHDEIAGDDIGEAMRCVTPAARITRACGAPARAARPARVRPAAAAGSPGPTESPRRSPAAGLRQIPTAGTGRGGQQQQEHRLAGHRLHGAEPTPLATLPGVVGAEAAQALRGFAGVKALQGGRWGRWRGGLHAGRWRSGAGVCSVRGLAGRVGVVRRLKGGGTDPADNRFLERGSCVSEVFCRIHL